MATLDENYVMNGIRSRLKTAMPGKEAVWKPFVNSTHLDSRLFLFSDSGERYTSTEKVDSLLDGFVKSFVQGAGDMESRLKGQ